MSYNRCPIICMPNFKLIRLQIFIAVIIIIITTIPINILHKSTILLYNSKDKYPDSSKSGGGINQHSQSRQEIRVHHITRKMV